MEYMTEHSTNECKHSLVRKTETWKVSQPMVTFMFCISSALFLITGHTIANWLKNKFRRYVCPACVHCKRLCAVCVFPQRIFPVLQPLNANQQWREGSCSPSRQASNTLSIRAAFSFISASALFSLYALIRADAQMYVLISKKRRLYLISQMSWHWMLCLSCCWTATDSFWHPQGS